MSVLEKIRADIDYYLKNNEFGMEYRNDIKNIIDKYETKLEPTEECDNDCEHCAYIECPKEPCDTISYNDDFATALEKISKYEDKKACEDAISRQAVLGLFYDLDNLYERIKHLPSVQPKVKCDRTVQDFVDKCRECGRIRKGHWIREIDFGNVSHYVCSECNEEDGDNFCPNYGADMRESEVLE